MSLSDPATMYEHMSFAFPQLDPDTLDTTQKSLVGAEHPVSLAPTAALHYGSYMC